MITRVTILEARSTNSPLRSSQASRFLTSAVLPLDLVFVVLLMHLSSLSSRGLGTRGTSRASESGDLLVVGLGVVERIGRIQFSRILVTLFSLRSSLAPVSKFVAWLLKPTPPDWVSSGRGGGGEEGGAGRGGEAPGTRAPKTAGARTSRCQCRRITRRTTAGSRACPSSSACCP